MRFEDFAFINDPKTGLVCSCVPVNPATEELTKSVRSFYVERVTQFGYTGFSWEIDDLFHRRWTLRQAPTGTQSLLPL